MVVGLPDLVEVIGVVEVVGVVNTLPISTTYKHCLYL